jgi:uncharacterized repeat protein (TIGR02543 family)
MTHLFFKRALALILILALILGSIPAEAFAVETRYDDTSGHWAAPAIERWSDYGVLTGHAGLFYPDNPITRGEMAAVLTRAIGHIAVDDNPFSDVDSGKWYHEYVLKLATAGIMTGFDGKARPEDNITREEAATLFARAFDIPEKVDDFNPFKDKNGISSWASGYVSGLHSEGYITGRPGGNFDPKASITRAEVVTILDNIVKAFYNDKGEYSGNMSGNALIRADGVTLNNMTISGDLYLTEGIGFGEAVLNDITVTKTTHIRGGGPNSIRVIGGDLGLVELNSINQTHLDLSGGTKVAKMTISNTGTVTWEGLALAFDATTGFLTLSGTFDNAIMNADGTMTVTTAGIDFVIIPSEGRPVIVDLTAGSVIKDMSLNAPLQIIGTGRIDKMDIHASGSVVLGGIIVKLESITLDKDVTVTIGGEIYTGTGGALTAGGRDSTLSDTVTVTFQTNGGSDISLIQVPRGETLPVVPMPVKENHAFIGWYTDQALSKEFYSDVAIKRDITLYANYALRNGNMRVFVDPNKYIENCDPNHAISILSSVTLTSENLLDYIDITSHVADIPALSVTGENGEYSLSPEEPYTSGTLYELTLRNDVLSFNGEDEAVRKLSFRIQKDETEIIELKENLIHVLWDDVTDLGEGAYTLPANKYIIEVDDTICLWNGVYDDSILFRNVVLKSLIAGESDNDDILLLNTQASNPEDVFNKLDIYVEQGIPIEDYLDQIDTNKIVQDVKYSEGTRQLTAMLNQAIGQSPTIQSLATEAGYFKSPSETTEHREIPVELLFKDIEDLEVSCIVGGTDNANFPNAFNSKTAAESEWGKDYSPVMTLTLKYSTVIKDKVKVEAEITIKEYLSASLQGGGKINNWNDFDFDYAINLYSQTDIFMNVLVKSVSQSPEYAYSINVTEEINKLLQGNAESDDDDPADILKKVLGDKGDYIDLVEANIIDIPIKIIPDLPVAELRIKLDFVIKANFAAGISSEATLLSARQIGIAGSSLGGYLITYDNELFGNNRYAIDIYAAGYVGFKAGLKGTMTLSFLGLEDMGKMGTSLEFGAYIDLYGFAHATIIKTYPNDYIHSGRKEITLDGAIYMELGLYLEMEIFVESKTFSAKAGLTVLDLKFPLLSVGDRYVLSKFLNNESHILMNTESLPLNSANGLLTAEFIDIKTGEKVTGSLVDSSKFKIQFSSPYITTQNNAIIVNKSLLGQDIKRLDFMAYIYYNGGALTFTGPREIYFDINGTAVAIDTPKMVKLTWIDSSIDASKVSGIETVQATYVLDIDGQETILDERTVMVAQIPGSIDLSAYILTHKTTGYENDFNEPIMGDTIYKIYLTPYQRLISFTTFYDGKWNFDVYAVNGGEKPVPPVGFNSTPGKEFTEWFVDSGYRAYTGGNHYFDECITLQMARLYGGDNIYYGLDTSKPIYSASGTLTDCYKAHYEAQYEGVTFNLLTLARYIAEYRNTINCTVTIKYPAMEYSAMGRTFSQGISTWTRTYGFGEPIVIPSSDWFAYKGCEMLGWDTNGDGLVDYDPKNPPIAGNDITFTAVMKVKTFDVNIQDHNGISVDRVTVNIGNLPQILSTTPVHLDETLTYLFKYWEVSKGGGEFVKWDVKTNPGVYENWTIRPVYITYEVTFLNGSDPSFTVLLPAGTYNVWDYVWFTPIKDSDDNYHYNFMGWDTGDTFTVTDDMTVTALFTAVPIIYALNFTTPYGELSTGGTTHTINSTYSEYAEAANTYIDANSTFAPIYVVDGIYTFIEWVITYVDIIDRVGFTYYYNAIWTYEPIH